MKMDINTKQIWMNAEDAQIGTVYATSIGGEPLLRIGVCAAHREKSEHMIAFLKLSENNNSLHTILYRPTDRVICIGEPTITIK
jgi:hypothetical protein